MNPLSTVLLRRVLFVWQLLWADARMPSTTPSEKPSTQRRTSPEHALPLGNLSRPTSLRLTPTNTREIKADKLDEAHKSNSAEQVLWQTSSPTPSAVKKISFVAFGDVPYRKADRYCLNKQLRELNQELMGFEFMVHVGDLKHGHEPCYESSFLDVAEMFSHVSNALNYDPRNCFFVPGDNEFQDCQNRTKAWGWWMKHFGNGVIPNKNGFSTLSDPNITVEYHTSNLFVGDNATNAGNFAFFTANVLFVGINQVGGGVVGDEKSRVGGNYKWVQHNMAKHVSRGMRAIVLFAHASMGNERQTYFGTPFIRLLKTATYSHIKALYIHGDGHDFKTCSPDVYNRNLFSLQVDGGEEANPLLISVMHDSVEDQVYFEINVRGGAYNGGCQAGNIDKTWSSQY